MKMKKIAAIMILAILMFSMAAIPAMARWGTWSGCTCYQGNYWCKGWGGWQKYNQPCGGAGERICKCSGGYEYCKSPSGYWYKTSDPYACAIM